MLALTWVGGIAKSRAGRLSAAAGGVGIAVALLASIGSFLSVSRATMTARAVAGVAVDWQVEAQPGSDPAAVLAGVKAAPGVIKALPVGFGRTTGFERVGGGPAQTTGPGFVLGLPDAYRSVFSQQLRDIAGDGAGVLLAQQTAANLHAAPGDVIKVGRAGMPVADVRIDGVVELLQADSLFQKVGAPIGAQPQAPPDNVLIVPESQWHELFDPLLPARPDLAATEIHVRLGHQLATEPGAAYEEATARARNLESKLAGAGLVGDNLGATLGAARSDALYAQVLFLFLGLPGAVLAGLLTAVVAGAGADRRRREQALLKARGASTRMLIAFSMFEAGLVGLVGSAAGLVGALVVGKLVFGKLGFGSTNIQGALWAGASALAGVIIAVVTIALPARRDARAMTVVASRRVTDRNPTPRWSRYGLDFIFLVLAASVFWLSGRNGYKLVLAPEGVPAVSVSYWAFAGPALLWSGGGLFAWRMANLALGRGRSLMTRMIRPLAGSLAGTVAASMSRQRRMLGRSLALVALTVAFAVSTAVFNSTYRQQAEVDARLSNGSDVAVTESPGSNVGPAAATEFAAVPGVVTVEPIQHRFAYVGADLQDLYGVRPGTIVQGAKLQDAYFQSGAAREVVSKLSADPRSILVGAETGRDFKLRLGDPLRLRLQDNRTKQLTEVVFRYAGVVKEFPTAPKDSFLVADAGYVAKMTASEAVGAFLIDTGGRSSQAITAGVRARAGDAKVTDLASSRRSVGSSLTAVDLAGLTRVELGFALILAAAATGLVLALGLAERRRMFAIAAALGAKARQLAGFVWSEALFVSIGGAAAGAGIGWVLSLVLVRVLTGVFDPPPARLAVPWIYLGALAAGALVAVGLVAARAVRATQRSSIGTLREL